MTAKKLKVVGDGFNEKVKWGGGGGCRMIEARKRGRERASLDGTCKMEKKMEKRKMRRKETKRGLTAMIMEATE